MPPTAKSTGHSTNPAAPTAAIVRTAVGVEELPARIPSRTPSADPRIPPVTPPITPPPTAPATVVVASATPRTTRVASSTIIIGRSYQQSIEEFSI
ncbi:hypothetical protein RHOER0001_3860 [Rhodococcus erythropolis SK121]|nr:hypothetical protein RHOER0001_3860 [Rhodococcus erythropolis SK121]